MGKKYYCEYCDKRFKDDPNIRKKHIDGLAHQKARKEHFAQFKSAQEILQEEQKKKPCAKFPLGICQFGATCRFSHYTPAQFANLQQQANIERQQAFEKQQPKVYSKSMIDDFMEKRRLAKRQRDQRILNEFFEYPEKLLKRVHELPPSLRPIDPDAIRDAEVNFFG